MPMDNGQIIAAGSVAGATGARVSGQGFVSARTGAGVYTITLDQPVDATQCRILVTARGTGFARCVVAGHTSDSVKQIEWFTLVPAAVDTDFDFEIRAFYN